MEPTSIFGVGVAWGLGRLVDRRRLPLTLFVLLVAATMAGLGFWQLSRREQRLRRNALIMRRMDEPPVRISGDVADPSALDYRPVVVAGTFDYTHEVVLRTRSRNGRAGVHVLTPLRLAGSDRAVLVDRGWIPFEESAPDARRVFQQPGAAEVHGLARVAQPRPNRFAPADADRPYLDAWFRADIARIQKQIPYPLLPIFVEEAPRIDKTTPPFPDETPLLGEGPHLGYAIQWFAFSVVLLAGYAARVAQPPAAKS